MIQITNCGGQIYKNKEEIKEVPAHEYCPKGDNNKKGAGCNPCYGMAGKAAEKNNPAIKSRKNQHRARTDKKS